jgi:hypothetical protein
MPGIARRPRERNCELRNYETAKLERALDAVWIPAFAGMTKTLTVRTLEPVTVLAFLTSFAPSAEHSATEEEVSQSEKAFCIPFGAVQRNKPQPQETKK